MKKIPDIIMQLMRKVPPKALQGHLRFVSTHDGSYNYIFNEDTGFFARCGKTVEENPLYSPMGPELLDMEISTICSGINGVPCAHCYKSNTSIGENMSFETFKQIFHKMPKNLMQIAFGIGSIDGNPDLFKIMEYCRINNYNKVAPNITINGWNLTDAYAEQFAKLCGAIAVSHYDDDICFNAVKKLADLGMHQVNIHQLVSEETFDDCMRVLHATKTDPRLAKLNAIVFLALKQKGRGEQYHPLSAEKYKQLINFGLENHASIGFDSCSAYKFLCVVQKHEQYEQFKTMAEPCESLLFSCYCNVLGNLYPCSFVEDEEKWMDGISLLNITDFMKEVWFNPRVIKWREELQKNKRGCPRFKV